MINLCKTAAVEFRDHGVRVNAMCPTFLETQLVRSAVPAFEAALVLDNGWTASPA